MSATVHTLVTDPVRLTSVLVTGSERALLIDTGSGPDQAVRILAAVRGLTDLPLTVANTHDHWDHFFGNPTFAEAGVTEFLASPAFVRDSPDPPGCSTRERASTCSTCHPPMHWSWRPVRSKTARSWIWA